MAFTPATDLLVAMDFEQLALSAVAQTLTPAKVNNCHLAIIVVSRGPGRIRTDGSAAAATNGPVVQDADELSFNRVEAQNLSAILASGAATCALAVTYYRVRVDA